MTRTLSHRHVVPGASAKTPLVRPSEPQGVSAPTLTPPLSRSELKLLRDLSDPARFLFVPDARDQEAGIFQRGAREGQSGAKGTVLIRRVSRRAFERILKADCLDPILSSQDTRARRYLLSRVGIALLARQRAHLSPPFAAQHQDCYEADIGIGGGQSRRYRTNGAESPLLWLHRRKGRDGAPLLSAHEFAAGERLRADFDSAALGPRVSQNWERFLTIVDEGHRTGDRGGDHPARERLWSAMRAMGPGLSDIALRVCCFLERIEAIEEDQGWAQRSGKVVLKLAMARLVRHYGLDKTGTGFHSEFWRQNETASNAIKRGD
ncbi:MAG: DUF6456 domain-containing protein [Neomegalonema sp.]|nr:DUF6456 domain-containing protein [Neomegalonema sp.]